MNVVPARETRRAGAFRGRERWSALHPVVEQDHAVTGDLTMHGVTNKVAFDLKAQREAANIKVNRTIPIVFAD